jgi:hypothetical protein
MVPEHSLQRYCTQIHRWPKSDVDLPGHYLYNTGHATAVASDKMTEFSARQIYANDEWHFDIGDTSRSTQISRARSRATVLARSINTLKMI